MTGADVCCPSHGAHSLGALHPGLQGLDQCIPDLTLKHIPDGSHWVIHERPVEVNALIREFTRT